ncbi:MAG: alanine--tRNA ligase [Gammaproteobacteria bacterium]|nr:alanine--tRNA ligase [Gammaproteobacteria bacterium]MCH9744300.1 alanine--tRNA ligase [Gammaproteobacteria bacterium]
MTISSNALRQQFLDYFKQSGHQLVPSSSLIPGNDPTLLFVNAGMVQFKDVFLGLDKRNYTRATSSQRCVRAGGKHNDLENVGFTKRHHTFFEMLGNFSFGDYFKKEAIEFAWYFLTEVLKIPKEKLWVTVYKEDEESVRIWLKQMKVDPKRFSYCGEKDNFWSMGDTGPCGPCTEIFYDHGPEIAGGPPGSPEEDGDRYVEIWNLVFMQYERGVDGKLTNLPKPCVDTGMGLERIAAVMQGVHDNYDIDVFQHLLKALSDIVDCDDFTNTSMRVIVDHIRSTAFLVTDGVTPSNEGRGYVLRRIIRRALRHGYLLGQREPFFYKLVPALVDMMGSAYPELKKQQKQLQPLLKQEEEQFLRTLENGLTLLDEAFAKASGQELSGEVVFQLYDTYGFPVDLTEDIAEERGFHIDQAGFEQAMQRQREQSKQGQKFKVDHGQRLHITGETEFSGYESLKDQAKVITLLYKDSPVTEISESQVAAIVLDKTPFYAESGGQVGDRGLLHFENGSFRVDDTQKIGQAIVHHGVMLSGCLKQSEAVSAEVDVTLRDATRLNHSATHMLHAAMQMVLGEHVTQKGSLVEPKRLRFDFSHNQPLTQDQINTIENIVNQKIRENLLLANDELSLDEAKQAGAMGLFGEKYGERVRVVKMGDFSFEICGGTHVERTGDIGLFKITVETSVASGIRRIEAVTGEYALEWVETQQHLLRKMGDALKSNTESLPDKVSQLLTQVKQLTREKSQLQQKLASQKTGNLTDNVRNVNGIALVALDMGEMDSKTLRQTVDQLKQQHQKYALLLAAVNDGQISFVCAVSDNCFEYFTAPDLLKYVAEQVDGRGGGRKDLAQGGGSNAAALPAALQSVEDWIAKKTG